MKINAQILAIAAFLIISAMACNVESLGDSETESGTLSGSYATMLTIGSHLYLINDSQITTYDINDPKDPIIITTQDVGFDIQSLYYYEGLLLIGSSNEMHIFELDSQGIPQRKSATNYNLNLTDFCFFEPIVVKNDYAYVTIATRVIDICSSAQFNELRVYDISNPNTPILIKTVNLFGPRGLAIGDGGLYVCDDTAGLKIFSIEDPKAPLLIQTIDGMQAYDCILKGDLLIVVCPDQLRQYKVLNDGTLEYLGSIQI